jgi:hypothetical protein
VEFCGDKGSLSLFLEGDSFLVVYAINRLGVNWSRYEIIIKDIQDILRGFQFWKTCHIKKGKEIGLLTCSLAQVGVKQVQSRRWIDCILEFIHHIVVSKIPSLIL